VKPVVTLYLEVGHRVILMDLVAIRRYQSEALHWVLVLQHGLPGANRQHIGQKRISFGRDLCSVKLMSQQSRAKRCMWTNTSAV